MKILKKVKCSECGKEKSVLSNKQAKQMDGLPHSGCGGKWYKC